MRIEYLNYEQILTRYGAAPALLELEQGRFDRSGNYKATAKDLSEGTPIMIHIRVGPDEVSDFVHRFVRNNKPREDK